MQQYWGGKAIAARVGIHPRSIYAFKRKYGLPGFLRVDPRNHHRRMLYASEAMILAWELAMSHDYDDRLRADSPSVNPLVICRPSAAQIQRRMKAYASQPVDAGAIVAESGAI